MSHERLSTSSFAPLGSGLPHPEAISRAQISKNIAFADKELQRWQNSTAWINDALYPTYDFRSLQPIFIAMSDLASDDNASLVNIQLKEHLNVHNAWSCCVVLEESTYWALTADIAMSRSKIADALLPLATSNIAASALLKTISVNSKKTFTRPEVLENTTQKPYWHEDDVTKGEKEEEVILQKFYAHKEEEEKD